MRGRRMFGQRGLRAAALAAGLAHLLDSRGGHQAVAASANQVLFTHIFQRLADQRPVGRIVVAQQRLVQPALAVALRHRHVLALVVHLIERILAGVIHGGGVGQRRRVEVLHLVEAEAVALEPQRQIDHILIGGAGVRRDKIGDQILLFARLLRVGIEQFLKAVVAAHARLKHFRQRPLLRMLRGNLQVAADVVGRQLFNVARIGHRQIVAHPGGDEDLLHALKIAGAAVEIDSRLMVGVHVRADLRIDAGEPAAGLLGARRGAAQHVHVGGRPAEIGDNAGKAGHAVANGLDLVDDRLLRTALDNAPLVLGDRAERAPYNSDHLEIFLRLKSMN